VSSSALGWGNKVAGESEGRVHLIRILVEFIGVSFLGVCCPMESQSVHGYLGAPIKPEGHPTYYYYLTTIKLYLTIPSLA
jgi:hypothetical protein